MSRQLREGYGVGGANCSDPSATKETNQLYHFLQSLNSSRAVVGTSFMSAGAVVADYPAMFEERFGHTPGWIAWEYISPSKNALGYTAAVSKLKAHHEAGGIVGIHCHIDNFHQYTLTPQKFVESYARDRSSKDAVACLRADSSVNTAARALWYTWLDEFSYFLNNDMVDSKGRKIPVIVRLFHEVNGFYNYLNGEGYGSGYTGSETLSITNVQVVGDQITFTYAAGLPDTFVPQRNDTIHVKGYTGASAVYNGFYRIYSLDSANRTVTSVFYETPQAVTGTPTFYVCTGFWWAGADRADDVMVVYREAVNRIRTTNNVHNALYATCLYPYNGSMYWSSNPDGADKFGNQLAYSRWYPGNSYVDVVTSDWYDRGGMYSGITMDNPTFKSSSLRMRDAHGSKPFLIAELGFDTVGKTEEGFWTRDFWNPLKKNMPFYGGVSFWDDNYFPNVNDKAFQSFKDMLDDPALLTLDRLNRGY